MTLGTVPRALLVGTDPAAMGACRETAEKSGFLVEAVESGIDAVIAARLRHPDLIVMETQLRDVPGHELVTWLRVDPALRSTPIIVLSSSAEDERELMGTSPSAALRKPIRPVTLRRVINDVMELS
ncbi:MAG TPA: response regulator [Stellaceae bacterium]|nr:response regulator [Stellaceae bacterium]